MRYTFSVICLSMLLTACDRSSNSEAPAAPDPQVSVVTLKIQPITLFASLPGRTTAVRNAEVRPQVDGIILKRLFTEGTEVKAGQQLYQIDPASYQAAYDKAVANQINADAVAKRYKPLAAAHAVSAQTYDDAVSTAAQAKADVQTARVNLEYTKVRAPISGRIGRSLSTEGALVTNGQSSYLTTISQLDPIYVDVSQSSQELLKLRRALSEDKLKAQSDHEAVVKLTLEDGTSYSREGQLEFSEVTVDEGTGSVTLRAIFPNPDNVLLPGMFVHARLVQGVQEQGILVPQEAIGHDIKGRPYVYVVNTDSTVEQRSITTGEMDDNGQWQVTSGLKVGEKLVTEGLQNIRSGIKVSASEQRPPASSGAGAQLSMTDPSAQ